MANGVATTTPNVFLFKFYKKLKIRGNMKFFEYNWSNCKNLELGGWIAKIKILVFELKNAVNFKEVN
jgi:hypothetical protein